MGRPVFLLFKDRNKKFNCVYPSVGYIRHFFSVFLPFGFTCQVCIIVLLPLLPITGKEGVGKIQKYWNVGRVCV